jgi:hypothetical protein
MKIALSPPKSKRGHEGASPFLGTIHNMTTYGQVANCCHRETYRQPGHRPA